MACPLRHGQPHETLRNRSVRFVIAILLIGLSGCGSQAPASQAPDAADGATAPATTSGEQTADDSPTGGAGAETTTLVACDLLSPDDLAELDVTAPGEDSTADRPSCRWNEALFTIGITILPIAVDDVAPDAAGRKQLTVGSRDAVQYEGNGGP